MKKKRAQSNIITTVLLILIGILLIIIIFNLILPLIKNSAAQINVKKFTTQFDIKDVDIWVTGGISIKVKRNSMGGLDSLKIIFYERNGKSHITELNDTTRIPRPIETRIINLRADEIPINNSQIDRISIYPVVDGQIGLESKEPESSIKRDSFGKRILDAPPETIGWWNFDGTAGDSIGNSHESLEGDAQITEDGELTLDGNGDYVNAGFQENLDIKGFNWTISVWANPADLSSVQYIIAKSDFSGSIDGRYALFLFANNFAAMIDDGIEKSVVGNIDVNPNQWVYLTAVYERGGDLSIYVDGVFDAAIPITDNVYGTTNLPFLIGYNTNALIYFEGLIDDVIVFQKVLSEDEIKGIYGNQLR